MHLRRSEGAQESSFWTTGKGIRNVATKVAQAMQVWTAVLNDKSENLYESEELGVDAELTNKMAAAMDSYIMWNGVIAMVADETKKQTATLVTESTTNFVEENIAYVIQSYNLDIREQGEG